MVRALSYLLPLLPTALAAAVTVLDPKSFDTTVFESNKPALVEFYAPWCGHCKNLAPVYEELATAFAPYSDKVTVANVDADEHKALGKKFGVTGFPTLKWFSGKPGAEPEDYKGGRDLESLTSFITEKTGLKPKAARKAPSSVVMLDDQSFKAEVGSEKDVLVAFTAPWCGRMSSFPTNPASKRHNRH
jgi:protein disulfide-isomerase A6